MVNNYKNDIEEMMAFIDCIEVVENNIGNIEECLKVLTIYTGEEFLDKRGDEVRRSFSEGEFTEALKRLSTYCSGSFCERCADCSVRKYCNTYIVNARNSDKNMPKIVDLFCGAGGLSLGFIQEGFRVALANDIEECCVDTYAHNHPEVPRKNIIQGDIRELSKSIEELLRDQSIDVVIGGPPCQGFSMANRQRLIDDPRNYLYKNYIEIVNRLRPKFFVMENVKGMLGVSNQVKEDFSEIGYVVDCKVLNAKDFGVPQNRERLIYIGNRIGADNTEIISEIEKAGELKKRYVLSDALYGLRPLEPLRKKNKTDEDSELSGRKVEFVKSESNEYIELINCGRTGNAVCNHKARYNNDRDIEIYRRLNQGDRSDDPKIADIMPYSNRNDIFKDKYYKLEENKVCKTITAHMKYDCNMYIHPTQARGLTPREAARVQSYPDDYFFRGSYTKTYMQIGNSVPPLLSRVIASVIKDYL